MMLSKEVLRIDACRVSESIEDFMKKKCKEMNRKGIVVPISGGLDSSVVAALCVRVSGKENVVGLMLPEREGNPDSEVYSRILADFLNIPTKRIDISDALQVLGTYDFSLSKIPTRFLKEIFVKSVFTLPHMNPFMSGIRGEGGEFIRKGMAHFYIKNRVRFVVACKFAEEHNLMLAGSAHKSEDLVGLFVKYGVDDLADVMPLKNLFRSQIMQLAQYLGIPEEIIERTPNPDIIPGVEDKYRDMLGIEPEKLDLILYGLENDMTCSEIAMELNLKEQMVEEIKELVEATHHMRDHSRGPKVRDII